MSKHPGSTPQPLEPAQPLKRRGWLVGAGTVGAAALAAHAIPGAAPEAAAVAGAAAPQAADTSAGYRLSAHVLRYYETTRS